MKVSDVLSLLDPDSNVALTFNVCGSPFRSVFTPRFILDSDNPSLRDSEVGFIRVIKDEYICIDLKGDFTVSPFVTNSKK